MVMTVRVHSVYAEYWPSYLPPPMDLVSRAGKRDGAWKSSLGDGAQESRAPPGAGKPNQKPTSQKPTGHEGASGLREKI